MSIAVVSSCYGGFDQILDPCEQTVEPDQWLMVTDADSVNGRWDVLQQPRPWVHSRFAAKHAKCQPFDYVDADIAIWLDSGAVIKSPRFVESVVDQLGDADIALWRHPERGNIFDEATTSAAMGKYDGQHPRAQAEHYLEQGLPDALWATGCIVWRNTEANRDLGRRWLTEQLRWSLQDQLSFPYVCWQTGTEPQALAQSLWRNDLIKWRGH